jgi:hypothetical protein
LASGQITRRGDTPTGWRRSPRGSSWRGCGGADPGWHESSGSPRPRGTLAPLHDCLLPGLHPSGLKQPMNLAGQQATGGDCESIPCGVRPGRQRPMGPGTRDGPLCRRRPAERLRRRRVPPGSSVVVHVATPRAVSGVLPLSGLNGVEWFGSGAVWPAGVDSQ